MQALSRFAFNLKINRTCCDIADHRARMPVQPYCLARSQFYLLDLDAFNSFSSIKRCCKERFSNDLSSCHRSVSPIGAFQDLGIRASSLYATRRRRFNSYWLLLHHAVAAAVRMAIGRTLTDYLPMPGARPCAQRRGGRGSQPRSGTARRCARRLRSRSVRQWPREYQKTANPCRWSKSGTSRSENEVDGSIEQVDGPAWLKLRLNIDQRSARMRANTHVIELYLQGNILYTIPSCSDGHGALIGHTP
jgi:hypothetical protein